MSHSSGIMNEGELLQANLTTHDVWWRTGRKGPYQPMFSIGYDDLITGAQIRVPRTEAFGKKTRGDPSYDLQHGRCWIMKLRMTSRLRPAPNCPLGESWAHWGGPVGTRERCKLNAMETW